MGKRFTEEERKLAKEKRKIWMKEYNKKYREEHPDLYKTKCKEWRNKNPEYAKVKAKSRRKANPELRIEYYLKNKEKIVKNLKEYHKKNPEVQLAIYNKRRSYKKGQPLALTNIYKDDIKLVYKKAKALEVQTGNKYNVDHIIPLTNGNVCGLHVPWNLQILTAKENCIKNNKFDGTYENESWRELFSIYQTLSGIIPT